MQIDLYRSLTSTHSPSTDLLDPIDIINAMIDLRFQLAELEQQIQILQPAFFAACIALNTDKITIERATIPSETHPWTIGLFVRHCGARKLAQAAQKGLMNTKLLQNAK